MSQWTHINGSIRVDCVRGLQPIPNFKELFKTCDWADDEDIWDACNVPKGSEGSVKVNIWENPEENHVAAYTVQVFGDLRDFGTPDYPEVKKWFEDICLNKGLEIRNAVLEVDIEYGNTYILSILDNIVIEHQQ